MAFKINDMDIDNCYIEGYTSCIAGETTLRLNCKRTVSESQLQSIIACHTELPTIAIEPASCFDKKGCKPIEVGDTLIESVRLDRKHVKQLIKELKRWLRRGC